MGEFSPFRSEGRREALALTRPLARRPSKYSQDDITITTTGVYSHAALLAAIQAVETGNVMFSMDYPIPAAGAAVQFLDTAFPAPADLARAAHGNADRVPPLRAGPRCGKAPHHVRKAQDRRRQNGMFCARYTAHSAGLRAARNRRSVIVRAGNNVPLVTLRNRER